MPNDIDILIFNTLLRKQGVSIPGIGSLSVTFQSSRREGHHLLPPRNTVVFCQTENEISLIEIISRAFGTDKLSAGRHFQNWLELKRREEVFLSIDFVGVINSNGFTLDERLFSELNPSSNDIVMERGARNRTLYVLLVIIIVLLGVIAWLILRIGMIQKHTEEDNMVPSSEQVVRSDVNLQVDSLSAIEQAQPRDGINECEKGISYAVYSFVKTQKRAQDVKDLLLRKGPSDAQVEIYRYEKNSARGFIVTITSDSNRISCAKKVHALSRSRISLDNVWIHTEQ